MRAPAAELRKLATLPGVWIGAAVGLVAPPAITVIAARQAASYGVGADADDGYQGLALMGVVGAIVIGVLSVSSEYRAEDAESGGGRPIATALVVRPGRFGLLAAKLAAVGVVVAVLAAVATAGTLTTSALASDVPLRLLDSGELVREAGVVVFWVLTAWIAQGITLLTRGGVVPLAVLIINSSLVSVSYLLSRVIPAANYLPDVAGFSMFIRTRETTVDVAPAAGGLVMLLWTAAVVAAAAIVFHRRDA
ncbi:hypothetical protein [Streptomyces sp. NPDC058045]|uniref:hypothetical protein n=1 Tax=Streptomyces sp. NPDC058045 TaxID=3346311 RepID=UPI0036E122F3